MTSNNILGTLNRYKVLLIAIFVSVVVAITAVTFIIPPKYTAEAKVAIVPNKNINAVSGVSYINSVKSSYIVEITSDTILQPVIDQLGLQESCQSLAQKVTASNPTDTQIIDIQASDSTGQNAADIANQIAKNLPKSAALLSGKEKEASAAPITFSVIQKAVVPDAPSSPTIKENIVLSILLGFVLDASIVLIIEYAHRQSPPSPPARKRLRSSQRHFN